MTQRVLLILGLVLWLGGSAVARQNVWIDADPACGLGPFDLGRQAAVRRADLTVLNTRGKLDRWLGGRSAAWLDFWESTLGADGFAPFDTLAVAYLTQPRHFSCAVWPAKIVRRRGLFVVRDTLELGPTLGGGNLVTYCWGLAASLRNGLAEFLANPDGATGPATSPRPDARRRASAGRDRPGA